MMAGEPEPSVSKDALVDAVAKKAGVSKKAAAEVISATLDVIVESVSDGCKVSLLGFGTFRPKDRPAREVRNPKTGDKLMVEAKTVPTFTFGSKFKDAVKTAHANK
jgi:DNA-binding protein HU-beta